MINNSGEKNRNMSYTWMMGHSLKHIRAACNSAENDRRENARQTRKRETTMYLFTDDLIDWTGMKTIRPDKESS